MGEESGISLVSTIIGFISFFVTVLTWINVFWGAFLNIVDAPPQVVEYLSTLRQSLWEERHHLRETRKRCMTLSGGKFDDNQRIYHTGSPLKVINDALKNLICDFKKLEKPFLIPPPDGGREKDLEWSYDSKETRMYYHCDLMHRIKWVHSRKGVLDVERRLNNLQMRRIAVETSEILRLTDEVLMNERSSEDRIKEIEHRLRMSRIE